MSDEILALTNLNVNFAYSSTDINYYHYWFVGESTVSSGFSFAGYFSQGTYKVSYSKYSYVTGYNYLLNFSASGPVATYKQIDIPQGANYVRIEGYGYLYSFFHTLPNHAIIQTMPLAATTTTTTTYAPKTTDLFNLDYYISVNKSITSHPIDTKTFYYGPHSNNFPITFTFGAYKNALKIDILYRISTYGANIPLQYYTTRGEDSVSVNLLIPASARAVLVTTQPIGTWINDKYRVQSSLTSFSLTTTATTTTTTLPVTTTTTTLPVTTTTTTLPVTTTTTTLPVTTTTTTRPRTTTTTTTKPIYRYTTTTTTRRSITTTTTTRPRTTTTTTPRTTTTTTPRTTTTTTTRQGTITTTTTPTTPRTTTTTTTRRDGERDFTALNFSHYIPYTGDSSKSYDIPGWSIEPFAGNPEPYFNKNTLIYFYFNFDRHAARVLIRTWKQPYSGLKQYVAYDHLYNSGDTPTWISVGMEKYVSDVFITIIPYSTSDYGYYTIGTSLVNPVTTTTTTPIVTTTTTTTPLTGPSYTVISVLIDWKPFNATSSVGFDEYLGAPRRVPGGGNLYWEFNFTWTGGDNQVSAYISGAPGRSTAYSKNGRLWTAFVIGDPKTHFSIGCNIGQTVTGTMRKVFAR